MQVPKSPMFLKKRENMEYLIGILRAIEVNFTTLSEDNLSNIRTCISGMYSQQLSNREPD
jgi:hypothetical protein